MTKIETLRFAYNYIWCLSEMLKNGGMDRSGESIFCPSLARSLGSYSHVKSGCQMSPH